MRERKGTVRRRPLASEDARRSRSGFGVSHRSDAYDVWQIITTEDDRDWHIVLRDPVDSSRMIVEIPDPTCTTDPTLAARFRAARDELRRVPKRGRARSGFELHPVLSIERL